MQDLVVKIEQCFDDLDELVDLLESSGCQLAENERKYRQELRIAELDELSAGTRVSVISDLCRGRDDIAVLKQRRDNSEVIYKATQEAINVKKLRVRVLNDQIGREWQAAGLGDTR